MLKSLTKNNTSANNRSKIYFCAHPLDCDTFLRSVSDEILNIIPGVAIWYDDYQDEKSITEELGQMQAFVVAVTSKFLTEPNSGLNHFRYAITHGIPVLPLMQEPGLTARFNEVCGNIQFLDKFSEDATEIAYEIKLDRFLKAHIVEQKLIEQLRNAFCAFVFLSYRKKNRKDAQGIMRRIHSHDKFKDIGFWYDEFLVAGEPFDEIIKTAIKDSHLVAFAVTPDFLEEGNYIQKEPDGEYLYAKSKDKTLIPIEIVDTDKDLLQQRYQGIPDCVSGTAEELKKEFEQQLKRLSIAHKPDDALHTYMLGIAYLNGIHVEMDKVRGVKYIESAYSHHKDVVCELPEATKTIAELYYWGNGVQVNYVRAAEYQLQYCNYLLSRGDAIENNEELVRELGWLADICLEPQNGDRSRVVSRKVAVEAYREVCERCSKILEADVNNIEMLCYYARCSLVLAEILCNSAHMYSNDDDKITVLLEAEHMYRTSIQLMENHPEIEDAAFHRSSLNLSYAYYAFARSLVGMATDYESGVNKAREAILLYKKAIDAENHVDKLSCCVRITEYYQRIAELYRWLKDHASSIKYFHLIIDACKTFPKNHISYEVIENRMVSALGNILEILLETGDNERALIVFKELSKYRAVSSSNL